MTYGRILVTGAAGMTASYVPDVFRDCELILTDLVDAPEVLDITDASVVRQVVGDRRPDVVLHLGAATDVDRCEQEPDWAHRTNAVGTENVANACREFEATMVYSSTAAVFAGDKTDPYVESDLTSPSNAYGRSKLDGEHAVARIVPRHFIVRAGWMIGGGQRDKKFVGKIVSLISEGRTELRAVDDKFGSPTYAADLIGGVRRLLETEAYGLYHMVNDGFVSRYDVAVAIRDILGRSDIHVEPVSSDEFPLPAPRGRSEAMKNLKLKTLRMPPMRPWRDALEEYVVSELRTAEDRIER